MKTSRTIATLTLAIICGMTATAKAQHGFAHPGHGYGGYGQGHYGNGGHGHSGYDPYQAQRRQQRQQIAGGIMSVIGGALSQNGQTVGGDKGRKQQMTGNILSGIGSVVQNAATPQPHFGGPQLPPQPMFGNSPYQKTGGFSVHSPGKGSFSIQNNGQFKSVNFQTQKGGFQVQQHQNGHGQGQIHTQNGSLFFHYKR